jgi:cytochrome P450
MLNLVNNRIHSGERRDDILQILVDSQQADRQEDRLTMDAIIAEVLLFLVAGYEQSQTHTCDPISYVTLFFFFFSSTRSETKSSTMGFALIELLRHPDRFEKLRAEIDNVPLENDNDSTLHSHSQLKNLPYLNAVLNETMRLHMIGSNGLQRMTDSDITLGNEVVIPKNVSTQNQ